MSFQSTNNKLFRICQWCNVCMLNFLVIHPSMKCCYFSSGWLNSSKSQRLSPKATEETCLQYLPSQFFSFYPNSACSWGWGCDVDDCSVTFALLLPPCLSSLMSLVGLLLFYVENHQVRQQFIVLTITTQNQEVLTWCINILLFMQLVPSWKAYQSDQMSK